MDLEVYFVSRDDGEIGTICLVRPVDIGNSVGGLVA
jgi:hypothetical protein